MIRPAAAFALGLAAGYVARSELERRRRPSPSGAERLRDAIAGDGGSAWTWSALRKILRAAEAGDRARSLTVVFDCDGGGQVASSMDKGNVLPETAALTPLVDHGEHVGFAFHALGVPDTPEGLEGAA